MWELCIVGFLTNVEHAVSYLVTPKSPLKNFPMKSYALLANLMFSGEFMVRPLRLRWAKKRERISDDRVLLRGNPLFLVDHLKNQFLKGFLIPMRRSPYCGLLREWVMEGKPFPLLIYAIRVNYQLSNIYLTVYLTIITGTWSSFINNVS